MIGGLVLLRSRLFGLWADREIPRRVATAAPSVAVHDFLFKFGRVVAAVLKRIESGKHDALLTRRRVGDHELKRPILGVRGRCQNEK